MFYLMLALLFSLLIAVVAMINGDYVTVNYFFGQAQLSLIVLILGSACGGAMTMGFFSLFRGIRTHLKFREAHHNQEELQRRLELLEEEKNNLEAELGKRQTERKAAVAKEQHTVEEASQAIDDPEPSRV
jgi:lipopolysaccharide assembly protein A